MLACISFPPHRGHGWCIYKLNFVGSRVVSLQCQQNLTSSGTCRQRSGNSVRSGVDPTMFPVATFEARQEAETLAEAFAANLNSKAGREIAAAKVVQKTSNLFQIVTGFWFTVAHDPPKIAFCVALCLFSLSGILNSLRLQIMMPSNVSGGFWLQNHQTVTAMMGRESVGVGVDIELECFEPSQVAEGYKHAVNDKGTRWAVRYLARKPSGSGMSGGWIYFAIDHVSHWSHTRHRNKQIITLPHQTVWHTELEQVHLSHHE